MDNQSLSLQERTRQGDSILDLSNVPQGAIAEFEWAISQDDQKDILKHYRRAVRNLYAKRRRLKNPINKKTGKPLKPATLKQYQSSLATHERDVRNYKCAIQMLIFYNYLEAHKTQARWVRKLKAKGQVLDYCQGLKEDEKSFVEAYRGDDVQAVLAIGHWKGYKAIRLASREYLANPQIRAALKTKRKNHLPLYKLIIGGGQGDGKPFKCAPYHPKGDLIRLASYCGDIFHRLEARLERIEDFYGGTYKNIGNDHRKSRAHDIRHQLFMELYDHHSSLVMGKSEPEWDAIHRLSKDIQKAEREYCLPRGNYQGY